MHIAQLAQIIFLASPTKKLEMGHECTRTYSGPVFCSTTRDQIAITKLKVPKGLIASLNLEGWLSH